MTLAEEKANELVERFTHSASITRSVAIKNALICVGFIHQENEASWSSDSRNYEHSGRWKYWELVKQEIQKLGIKPPPVDHTKYIEYINNQDVFWVKDMLIFFNVARTQPLSIEESRIGRVISYARKNNHIQMCNKIGANTQYITVTKIPLNLNKNEL